MTEKTLMERWNKDSEEIFKKNGIYGIITLDKIKQDLSSINLEEMKKEVLEKITSRFVTSQQTKSYRNLIILETADLAFKKLMERII